MHRRPRPTVAAFLVLVAATGLVAASCSAATFVAVSGGSGSGSGADVRDPVPHGRLACPEPGAGVEEHTVDPASVGMDPDLVRAAIGYAVAKGSQSVRIYRHGCLVGDGGDPLLQHTALPGWSMTKSVVSMLAGRAVTLGRMSIDDPIGRYLPVADPHKSAVTVRQLLNQTTGVRMDWVDDLLDATGDSVGRWLVRPFEALPGTTFNYSQTTVTTLGAVVQAAVGEDLQTFAQRELFGPVGITGDQWEWFRDGAGHTQGFAFLQMTPDAWSRLGRLLLQDGVWGGRRLLSADYVSEGRTGTAANPCYGFLWRNNDGRRCPQTGPLLGPESESNWMPTVPSDAFGMAGMFDQVIVVIPSLDMVVVRIGLPQQAFPDPLGDVDGEQPAMTWRFLRILMSGVTDVKVPDPGEWAPSPPAPVDLVHIFPLPVPEPKW